MKNKFLLLKKPIRIQFSSLMCCSSSTKTLEVLRPVAASSWPHLGLPQPWRWDVPQTCGKLMAWCPIQDYPYPEKEVPPTEPTLMMLRRPEGSVLYIQTFFFLTSLQMSQYKLVGDLFIQLSTLMSIIKPVGDLFISTLMSNNKGRRWKKMMKERETEREGLHYHVFLRSTMALFLCTSVQQILCYIYIYFSIFFHWINQFDLVLTQLSMS